jgi:hypothetical protein
MSTTINRDPLASIVELIIQPKAEKIFNVRTN